MFRSLSPTRLLVAACIAVATLASAPGALAQPVGGGSATPSAVTPAEVKTRLTPKFVSIETVEAEFGNDQTIDEERIVVELPGEGDALTRITFSNVGGTVYAAHLLFERYTRDPLPPMTGVPVEKLAGGPIDVVSTWGPSFRPFQVVFPKLAIGEPVTRVIRRATKATAKKGYIQPPKPGESTVRLPVNVGDDITFSAPATLASGGPYKVASVLSGSIATEPALPQEDLAGLTYEIKRSGAILEQYTANPTFARVSPDNTFPLIYVWPAPGIDDSPVYIEKRFEVGDHAYNLDLTVTIYNRGKLPLEVQSGLEINGWQHPDISGGSMFQRPTNLFASSCYADNSLQREEFPSLQSNAQDHYEETKRMTYVENYKGAEWIGMDTAYFMVAAANASPANRMQCNLGFQFYNGPAGAWRQYSQLLSDQQLKLSPTLNGCLPDWLAGKQEGMTCSEARKVLGVQPGANKQTMSVARNNLGTEAANRAYEALEKQRNVRHRYELFLGPKDVNYLEKTTPTLAESLDLGMFSFIAKPLHQLLVWIHSWAGSWALAIILLTIMVKLVLLPLTNKSYRSMQKMQQLKPKLDVLKKQHGEDRQAFAREQMALFKREGVNPLGGCLPMLLQMPVWFGLYQTIYSSVELYHAPMGLWIQDLSAPDPYYIMPIVLGLLMFVQTFLTTSTATMDGLQGKLLKFGMPVMFSAFMLFLPAGLVLYILVNVTLTIAQNLIIKKRLKTT